MFIVSLLIWCCSRNPIDKAGRVEQDFQAWKKKNDKELQEWQQRKRDSGTK